MQSGSASRTRPANQVGAKDHILRRARSLLQGCNLVRAASWLSSSAAKASFLCISDDATRQLTVSFACSASHLIAASLRHLARLVDPVLFDCNTVSCLCVCEPYDDIRQSCLCAPAPTARMRTAASTAIAHRRPDQRIMRGIGIFLEFISPARLDHCCQCATGFTLGRCAPVMTHCLYVSNGTPSRS